jgi:hypothetical protein
MTMRDLSRRAAVLLLFLYSFPGCGGGGGSSAPSNVPAATPTPAPAPTPVPAPVIRNGWTEEGVTAEVTPPSPSIGTAVTVKAPGFLVREQPFAASAIFLWPSDESWGWPIRAATATS